MKAPSFARPNAGRRAVFTLAVVGYSFGVVASVMSYISMSGGTLAIMNYDKVILSITVLVGLFGLIRSRDDTKLDGLGFVMLFMVLWATGLGVLSFFFEDRSRSFRYFLPQFAGGVMMTVAYLYFSKIPREAHQWLDTFMARAAPTLMCVSVTSFLVYIVFIPELNIAFSASTFLVPFAWFLIKKNPIGALTCFAFIFISGKRGTMIAALFALLVLLVLWSVSRSPKDRSAGFLGLISIFALAVTILPLVLTVDIQTLPGPIRGSLGRIQLALRESSEEGGDLRVATAGRSGEIEDSWKTYASKPRNYWIGTGYGWWFWNYGIIAIKGYDNVRKSHYIHASPINYIYWYGIPIASIFFLLLLGKLFSVFTYISKMEVVSPGLAALFIFLVGRFTEGATGASWYTDPFIWIAFGTVVGLTRLPERQKETAPNAVPATN